MRRPRRPKRVGTVSVELVVVCEWPDLQPGYAGKQGQTGDSKHED